MPLRVSIFALASFALTLAACSGGGGGGATPAATSATSAASTPAASATGGAVSTASAGTPGAGETAAATPGGGSGATDPAALAAAESIFHGVAGADCAQAADPSTTCLQSLSTAETIAAGISAWKVSAQGGSSYTGVLGRAADGSWKLWFSSQDVIWQLQLPGTMRVCADGQGLNLRKTAATTGERLASIADNEIVEGDKFVLTEPGTPTQHGYGWYHLPTTPDGWAYSKFLVDSTQPNCDARNRLEASG
ncbi:MAG: hypothetical protein EPO22_11740 [Dehalococcoidia bacterium]|nr:MAG: hypothetical protein EPO22_11740 [Dehalococcoidia bacterium]